MKREFYFAQKAFIIKEGKLLLIQKSAADPNQANKWEVPGGRMKFGEEPNDHLRREVMEEVGLNVVPGSPFHIWQWQLQRKAADGDDLQMQIVAVARICEFTGGEISFDSHEEDDFISKHAWVDIDEVDRYDLIANMIPVVASLRQFLSRGDAL